VLIGLSLVGFVFQFTAFLAHHYGSVSPKKDVMQAVTDWLDLGTTLRLLAAKVGLAGAWEEGWLVWGSLVSLWPEASFCDAFSPLFVCLELVCLLGLIVTIRIVCILRIEVEEARRSIESELVSQPRFMLLVAF